MPSKENKDAPGSHLCRTRFLFVNKTARSASLSHSAGEERIRVFSTAQRTSRIPSKVNKIADKIKNNTTEVVRCKDTNRDPSEDDRYEASSASPPQCSLNRVQLLAHFFQSYYPESMPGQAKVVGNLRTWMEPRRGAIAFAAADAMVLLHAAQTVGDETFWKEGMRRYHLAVQLVRDGLQDPDSVCDDSILGAIEIMVVIETRLLQSSEEKATASAHIRGLYALVVARGPSILGSEVGKHIVLQHLHEFRMVSLLARRACVFGNSDWQAAFRTIGHHDMGKMNQLTALGCCIPGALEKADATIKSSISTGIHYMNLLAELIALEDCFHRWLLDRYRNLPSDQPYRISSTLLSTWFDKQPAELKTCYPFLDVIEHHCLIDVLAHLNYWGLLLILRRTVFDVLTSFQSVHPSTAASERCSYYNVRARGTEIADLFCQSACYVYGLPGQPGETARQAMMAFLIVAIIPWYSQNQQEEKVKWCNMLLRDLRDGGTEFDLPEAKQVWTANLYIGWVNMAF